MPPAAEAVRLAGNAVMTHGGLAPPPAVVVAGLALVVLDGHTASARKSNRS